MNAIKLLFNLSNNQDIFEKCSASHVQHAFNASL